MRPRTTRTATRVLHLQEDNKTLKEENTMIKQCLMEMSEIVYA